MLCLFGCWVFVTGFISGNYKCWLSQLSLSLRLLPLKHIALMHIKVFNMAQARHVAQAVHEYWHNSCAMFQTRSLQVLGQFHTRQTEGFHEYIAELVHGCLLCVFPMLIISSAWDADCFWFNKLIWSWCFLHQHWCIAHPRVHCFSYWAPRAVYTLDQCYSIDYYHDECSTACFVLLWPLISKCNWDGSIWWKWRGPYYCGWWWSAINGCSER